ncbi:MAG: dihydroorotase [Promethearchaeota archaeon]
MDIIIKNGWMFDPTSRDFIKKDIGIRHGQIIKISDEINAPAEITINAKDKYILPGFIDSHVHLRDLEQGYKETITSGTKAAIHGGVTTVFTMPNTSPPLTTLHVLKDYLYRIQKASYCNVGVIGGYPREGKDELERLKEEGIYAVKIYMEHSIDDIDWSDDTQLKEAIKNVASLNIPLHVHAGVAHEKEQDDIMYWQFIEDDMNPLEAFSQLYSPEKEALGVKRACEATVVSLKEISGRDFIPKVHFCHLSSMVALDVLKTWKKELHGMLSSEVTPHHLFLNNSMTFKHQGSGKVLPPLRTSLDNGILLKALKNGDVDFIASDHAPHGNKEKTLFLLDSASGFSVLDIYAPLIMTFLIKNGFSFSDIVRLTSESPARYWQLNKRKGKIQKGFDADLIILEKREPEKINNTAFFSQSRITPYKYQNFKLEWRVSDVIVNGDLQLENCEFVGQPANRLMLNKKIVID